MTNKCASYFVSSCLHFRSVSVEDVTKIERKLLQTMEMIALKKKKIALAQREKRERARGRGELLTLDNDPIFCDVCLEARRVAAPGGARSGPWLPPSLTTFPC